MKILTGSENPVKIEAVREAFSHYFDDITVVGIPVQSNVGGQPFNDETFEGAHNRALLLRKMNAERSMNGQFFIGLEGGVLNCYSRWFVFGAVCIIDSTGRVGFGGSPLFEIPSRVSSRLADGTELGDIVDEITGDRNTKQKEGAIGLLSRGFMKRKDLYTSALVCALVPFLNADFFNDQDTEHTFEKPHGNG